MIVADTNVIVRGIRSPQGASGYVLKEMLRGNLNFAISPAVVLEYEDVLSRPGILGEPPVASPQQIEIILDALCCMALKVSSYFRFRPFLDDPKDDLFVECAFAAGAQIIVTDDRHFRYGALKAFGVRAMSAREFILEVTAGEQ